MAQVGQPDLAMPFMNGLAAAREIAKMLSSVPIVMFTLYDSQQITLAAKEAG